MRTMVRNGLWGALWLLFLSAPAVCAQESQLPHAPQGALVAWIAEPWTRDGGYDATTADYVLAAPYVAPSFAPPSDDWWFRPSVVPSTFEDPIIPLPPPETPPSLMSPPTCTMPAAPRFPLLRMLWTDQRNYH